MHHILILGAWQLLLSIGISFRLIISNGFLMNFSHVIWPLKSIMFSGNWKITMAALSCVYSVMHTLTKRTITLNVKTAKSLLQFPNLVSADQNFKTVSNFPSWFPIFHLWTTQKLKRKKSSNLRVFPDYFDILLIFKTFFTPGRAKIKFLTFSKTLDLRGNYVKC